MKITADQLRRIVREISSARAEELMPHLNAAAAERSIATRDRLAAFIANTAHESANYTRFAENLNYSAAGLALTWPKRFAIGGGSKDRFRPNALALRVARQPQEIANIVYANRLGNAAPASGEGWKFRGRGPIQITGRDNYLLCSRALFGDERLLETPELLEESRHGFHAAAWFWASNGLNALADRNDFDGICDVINLGRKTQALGDALGYRERLALLDRACEILGES